MSTNIYILKLEGGNYYVGKSDNPAQRFIQHINGEGAGWTKKYRPIKLLNIIPNASGFDEDKHVKELMAKYGIEKVRGGTYVQDKLSAAQEEMLKKEIRGATDCCTRCGKEGHFVANCWAKKEADSPAPVKTKKGTTYTGRIRDKDDEIIEYEEECESKKSRKYWSSVYEIKKSPSKQPQTKSGACYRCGRTSHWSPDCYATTHVNGYELSEDEDDEDDEDSD